VFEQFRRVLRPQGLLLVGFHVGDEIRHTSEGYTGRPVNIDSHHRRPSTITGWLRDAKFTIEAELVIGPDDNVVWPQIRVVCHRVATEGDPGSAEATRSARPCSPTGSSSG
jgi:hypothetical protein